MSVVRTLIGNVKGPQGDTGATGPQGTPGTNGTDGAAATISVGTVSTTAYGNPAEVTNSGTSSAAVFDFVIPQGQPGEEVTDMSGLTLGTMTTQTAQYPTPQIGDNGATLWGKVVKYFSDLRTAIGTKFNAANVVNNFTTTESGYALDARAGKTLNDSLTDYTWYESASDSNVFTLSSAYSSADISNLKAKKSGRVIEITGTIGSLSLTSGRNTIGTLNEKFRPRSYMSYELGVIGTYNGCGNLVRFEIGTDGNVVAVADSASTNTCKVGFVFLGTYTKTGN